MKNNKIIFRMDDIFSSSKKFEVYGKFGHITNFLFLKYLPIFQGGGPYRELFSCEWSGILRLLKENKINLTVGITAMYVEQDATLTPFFKRYPWQAKLLKQAFKDKLIEIANHGLTHCVLGKHLPKLFLSNRKFHREFWSWLPKKIHFNYLKKSQSILQNYFKKKIITFIPPGGIWTRDTEIAAVKNGLKYLCAQDKYFLVKKPVRGLTYIKDSNSFVFHDKDVVKNNDNWLKEKINFFKSKNKKLVSVRAYMEEK